MKEFPKGAVWLVGAGPGDPGLLTLNAVEALKQADVIIYDALVNPAVLDWARADCEKIKLGKRGGRPSIKQTEITARLIDEAKSGKRVLRLKGGDPFVFGRGGEEALALVAANIPMHVIPGITAGIGGLAAAGIPVTHRDVNQSVTFLTGHDHLGLTPSAVDWAAVAGSGMIVMYMATRNIAEISAALIKAGRATDDPVCVVKNATLPDMEVLESTLATVAADIANIGIGSPAIISVGRGNLLREQLG